MILKCSCGCQFEYDTKNIKFDSNINRYYVNCPLCGTKQIVGYMAMQTANTGGK